MKETREPEMLPSIDRLLRRANALERVSGVDVAAVSRQPVFQSRAWLRSISEFLRWSGTTLQADGGASVFDLVLCHGRIGARTLLEAYRHDRLERAEKFEDADAQIEAVRTLVNMAAHWVQTIDWDLRDAPRLSSEEYRAWRANRKDAAARAARTDGNGDSELPELVTQFLFEESERGGARKRAAIPVFPSEGSAPGLWKSGSGDVSSDPSRPRRRDA